MKKIEHPWVHFALFIVALIYASSFTIAKELVPSFMHPRGAIVMRISGALVLIFIYHRIFIRQYITKAKDLIYVAFCAIFGVALNMIMFFEGLALTSPVNASLIMVTTPILVVLISYIIKTERITISKVAGIIIGGIGAALLIINKSSPTAEGSLLGDVFILINAASYSVYLVLVKKLMKTYHPITVTLYAFIFGLLIVAPFGLDKFLQTNWSLLSPNLWFAAVFLVLGTTFLTYVLNAVSLKYVPSSVVSGYIYLQPFLGTLIAVLSGKYSLQAYQIIYGIFILLGVYLTTKRTKKVN
jgi:drug/metabolite transporter (DMT)-like permease